MQINATNNLTPLPERTRRVAGSSTTPQDTATFAGAESLDKKMSAAADVRSDEVARAQALIAAPQYPPEKTIRSIAKLLAMNLDPDNQ